MFGFKPMITGSPVMISSDGTKPMRFNSLSKASTSTGIPYNNKKRSHTQLDSRKQVIAFQDMLPFYMPRRIPGIEFALVEKNIQ